MHVRLKVLSHPIKISQVQIVFLAGSDSVGNIACQVKAKTDVVAITQAWQICYVIDYCLFISKY